MYLISVFLSVFDIKEHRISDNYSIHRVVYSLFNEQEKGESRDFIYYVNKNSGRKGINVLISSVRKPDNVVGEITIKEIGDSFFSFSNYVLEIYCNPTKTIDGRKVAIKKESDLHDWIERQLSKYDGLSVNITSDGVKHIVSKLMPNEVVGKNLTQVGAVNFIVSVNSTNPDSLKKLIQNGIGRGKGFGLGMVRANPVS